MSARPERKVVLDASAVLAWVFTEKGSSVIDQILPVGVIASANMTEVLYRAREKGYRGTEEDLLSDLLGMGLTVEPVTEQDCVRAALLIGQSRSQRVKRDDPSLSLGDGLCFSVAERLGLTVTGGDEHWETLNLPVEYRPFP